MYNMGFLNYDITALKSCTGICLKSVTISYEKMMQNFWNNSDTQKFFFYIFSTNLYVTC